MSASLLSADRARHCACNTPAAHTVRRSHRAVRVAEHAAQTGVDPLAVSLRHATGQLLADLATMDDAGLCRGCGWPLLGRRSRSTAGLGRWDG